MQVPTADTQSFIPTGKQNSTNFNVKANVSKASRGAKHLNAYLASKINSLNYGGKGKLFRDISKIELNEMQGVLTNYKHLKRKNGK